MPLDSLLRGDFVGFITSLLLILPALVIAMSFHEWAHAWMANKMGDPTAKNLGRMTIDPIKHIDIWGLISFALLGFGWGKPVPINSNNFTNYKKGNILVSLAGVTVNLIICIVTLGIIAILYYAGVFMYAVKGSVVFYLLLILIYIANLNLMLCIFNLIPIPPLDGHHLIKGFIAKTSPRFYMAYMNYGFIFLLILLFAVPGFSNALYNLVVIIFNFIAHLFGLPSLL